MSGKNIKPEIILNQKVSLAQVAVIALLIICGGALLLFVVSGTWPALVAVESDSMSPNLNTGDMVLIVQKDRFGSLMTADEARASGRMTLGGYGDVIVYTPNGNTHITPLLHRIVSRVNETAAIEQYAFTPEYVIGGYITKGDNNNAVDQTFSFNGIGRVYPVKEEWVSGKALFAIPFVGYLLLNVWPISVIILALLLLYEGIGRRADRKEEREKKEKKEE
ncbi:MAG: S26 family signal peptidase [Methanocorpusculum sp.]|nr:S26 family signal peptidase [Methanocorpusculum sp.]